MTTLNHWLRNIIQHWVNSAVCMKYDLAREADLPVLFSDKKSIFITTLWLHMYFTVCILHRVTLIIKRFSLILGLGEKGNLKIVPFPHSLLWPNLPGERKSQSQTEEGCGFLENAVWQEEETLGYICTKEVCEEHLLEPKLKHNTLGKQPLSHEEKGPW